MTATHALDWFREVLWRAVLIAGPPVFAVVIIGLIVAILQATTQVNDQAIAFAPKGLAAVGVITLTGPWILSQLTQFMVEVFVAMGQITP